MLHNGLLNLQSAQHVSDTIMAIIRSSRLYRRLQHVAHNTLFKAGRVVYTYSPHQSILLAFLSTYHRRCRSNTH